MDGTHENDPLGLYGYNCRHSHYVWFEGISTFPKEDLEPQPVTINGKTYDYYAITQKQRAMERSVRTMKREREALKVLNMDTKDLTKKIRRKMTEYEDFCKEAKVKPDINRMRYESGTSDLTKTKAWKKYQTSVFEEELKAKTLGAADSMGDGSEPVYIGQIDISKKEEAIEYFGEQIRDSEIEKLYVIDKNGNVYYNEGIEDAVSVGNLDLTDCTVLHNHPKSNGIVSFGEDDFNLMRDFQSASYKLVNRKYNYSVEIIVPIDNVTYKEIIVPIDNVTYNQAWRWAIEDMKSVGNIGELQHRIMQSLAERGHIKYERKEVVGRAKS